MSHYYASPRHVGCGKQPGSRGNPEAVRIGFNQPYYLSTDPRSRALVEGGGASTFISSKLVW